MKNLSIIDSYRTPKVIFKYFYTIFTLENLQKQEHLDIRIEI